MNSKHYKGFKILFFNWRIIALQNFVFCQTSTRISHRYTYIPYLLNLPPYSIPYYKTFEIAKQELFDHPQSKKCFFFYHLFNLHPSIV